MTLMDMQGMGGGPEAEYAQDRLDIILIGASQAEWWAGVERERQINKEYCKWRKNLLVRGCLRRLILGIGRLVCCQVFG
jgi:hypothetical protein